MIEASATCEVRRSSREVLEFVLDLDRYRQVDPKIGRVTRPIVLDGDGNGTTRYWGRMRGTPSAPDVNIVRLTPWTDLTFTGAPRQPARLILDFEGRFHCTESDEGCTVTHSYELRFRRPFRWIYEPLLRTWLQDELTDELARLADVLDHSTVT